MRLLQVKPDHTEEEGLATSLGLLFIFGSIFLGGILIWRLWVKRKAYIRKRDEELEGKGVAFYAKL